MGTSLNGLTPAGTYPGLIKTGDNAPIDGTLKTLSDGNGNNLPMAVSTTAVNFTNQLQQSGVAVPTASQVAAKQDTLVSGTNIKTINSTSILGSGNIAVVTSPSGVAGAIQFSNGSAFASDATNLFWDDTNNRLGVGTNAPTTALDIQGANNDFLARFGTGSGDVKIKPFLNATYGSYVESRYADGTFMPLSIGASRLFAFTPVSIGTDSTSAMLQVKGSGSTSATTSLLVQNSAGTAAMTVRDDLLVVLGGSLNMSSGSLTAVSVECSSGVFAPSGGNGVKWGGNVFAISNTNGILKLSNGSNSDWDRLQFGGTTSSFPALKKSGTTLQSRLADDSGYAPFDASLYKVGGTNGFTGTGSYTNFTIVGGIITNAS